MRDGTGWSFEFSKFETLEYMPREAAIGACSTVQICSAARGAACVFRGVGSRAAWRDELGGREPGRDPCGARRHPEPEARSSPEHRIAGSGERLLGASKPRNPRHFDTIAGGRDNVPDTFVSKLL